MLSMSWKRVLDKCNSIVTASLKLICYLFAIFATSYGKELLQILHLAAGDAPEQGTADAGSDKGAVEAELRQ